MRFAPKSEEEVSNLIPKGEYPFVVLEAEDKQSKKGNDMLALKLGIVYGDSQRAVFDYLVEAVEYKLRHFADAIGLLEAYEKGQLSADDVQGCTGKCKLDVDPAKDGYEAKNVVRDYIKRGGVAGASPMPAAVVAKVANGRDPMDDEIPF